MTFDPLVRFAEASDINWLAAREHSYATREFITAKVAAREYLLGTVGDLCVGFLRFSLFGSRIPFIDLILVDENERRRGVGRAMLAFLEAETEARGLPFVMSSSQADEAEPQAWHRHMGFRDAGVLVDLAPLQSVPEMIFVKNVTGENA